MKTILKISAAILSGTTLMFAAAPAMARVDVNVHFGVPGPVYYGQPHRVYSQPQPHYIQPHRVYVQPQQHFPQPHRVYYNRDDDRDDRGYRHHYRNHDNDGHRGGKHVYRDRDGDGVPNRYDSRPNNPYRY